MTAIPGGLLSHGRSLRLSSLQTLSNLSKKERHLLLRQIVPALSGRKAHLHICEIPATPAFQNPIALRAVAGFVVLLRKAFLKAHLRRNTWIL
jgi:hypothetical protein